MIQFLKIPPPVAERIYLRHVKVVLATHMDQQRHAMAAMIRKGRFEIVIRPEKPYFRLRRRYRSFLKQTHNDPKVSL